MPARSPSRRRALSVWLALTPPLLASAACVTVPEDIDEPDATPVAPSTAGELLDRHVAAIGGDEALRALPQRTVEARVVFKAQEDCEEGDPNCVWEETIGQFVLFTTADGRMYRKMRVGDNVLERGFDGQTGWQMQADPQMLIIEDPAATPVLREDALLHWYLDVDTREDLALELLPSRETEDGRQLDGIKWFAASPASPQSEKWFDRETGLLHEEIERDTETGDVVRRIYSDYREVDGVLAPWMIEQITVVEGYADQVVELRIQVINHRPVREELFAVPDLGPTEPEPDQLLAALDAARLAAEDAKDSALAQVQHARLAYYAVHFDEARAAAKRALAIDKSELEATYILARIAMLEGDLREGEKLVRKAMAAGLREDEAARQLAWIHMRKGDWIKSATQLERAGSPALAARYALFSGKPLSAKMAGDGCSTTVAIETIAGAVIVPTSADGEPLRLLLDTGASDLIISDERAHSLVIGTDAEAPLVAGGPSLKQGQLDLLTIGDYSVNNVPVTMFPANQMSTVVGIEGVDGVLGIRPFAERQLSVDRQGKTLGIVEPSARCKAKLEANRSGVAIPFWVHETHYLYVLGHMNGAEGLYLLNTGMRGADLTANETAYAHAGIGAPAMQAGAPSLARVESFELGGFSRKELGAAWGFLQQTATTDGFRLDGMLGLEVLGRGRWTLDYQQQRMYLNPTKPEAPKQPRQPKPSGGE